MLAAAPAFLAFGTVTAAPEAARLVVTIGRNCHDSSELRRQLGPAGRRFGRLATVGVDA